VKADIHLLASDRRDARQTVARSLACRSAHGLEHTLRRKPLLGAEVHWQAIQRGFDHARSPARRRRR
jgi:hypothetical protein